MAFARTRIDFNGTQTRLVDWMASNRSNGSQGVRKRGPPPPTLDALLSVAAKTPTCVNWGFETWAVHEWVQLVEAPVFINGRWLRITARLGDAIIGAADAQGNQIPLELFIVENRTRIHQVIPANHALNFRKMLLMDEPSKEWATPPRYYDAFVPAWTGAL